MNGEETIEVGVHLELRVRDVKLKERQGPR